MEKRENFEQAEGPGSFTRVTGTCVGGGTVLGLARLLLGVSTFAEVIDLSLKGTNSLDLTVEDLYGDAAGSQCLPGATLASRSVPAFLLSLISFGRLYVPFKKGFQSLQTIRFVSHGQIFLQTRRYCKKFSDDGGV